MALAVGYLYKDKFYWRISDSAGPYALGSNGEVQKVYPFAYVALPVPSNYVYKHGAYWKSDGSGPYGFE